MRWPVHVPALVLGATLPLVASAKTTTIQVRVVDRTTTTAFVEPGGGSGLRAGDQVVLGGRKRRVVAVTASYATVDVAGVPPEVGARGTATIEADRAPEVIERIRPAAPLSAYAKAWAPAVAPASRQHPKPVPLGPVESTSVNRVTLRVTGAGVVPLRSGEQTLVRLEERVLAHWEPIRSVPFRVDADVAAQQWFAGDLARRASSASRPPVAVRQLELGYGADAGLRGAGGRLRYGSSFLGTLDGLRVDTPAFEGFSAAAFGGVVPDTLSGAPDLAARRFGGEVRYDAPDSALRPRVVLGGHASHFDGALDERRLDAAVDLFPDVGRFGARTELAFFDRTNPWGAAPLEVQSVDADFGVNVGPLDVRLAGGMRRPERSRWLATFLPPEWLCFRASGPVLGAPCLTSGAVYSGTADAGVGSRHVGFDVGGSVARTEGAVASQTTAFANLRLRDLPRTVRLDLGAMLARGSLLRTGAITLTPGVELMDGRADLSIHYRPAVTRYIADTGPFVEHDVGPVFWIAPMPSLELTLGGDYIQGRDLHVILFQTSATYRPSL